MKLPAWVVKIFSHVLQGRTCCRCGKSTPWGQMVTDRMFPGSGWCRSCVEDVQGPGSLYRIFKEARSKVAADFGKLTRDEAMLRFCELVDEQSPGPKEDPFAFKDGKPGPAYDPSPEIRRVENELVTRLAEELMVEVNQERLSCSKCAVPECNNHARGYIFNTPLCADHLPDDHRDKKDDHE